MADRKNNNVVKDLKSLSSLDGDAALRDSHSYPGHYIRTRESVTAIEDFYDSFEVTYNTDNNPTQACYYVGTKTHLTTIACKADIALSLQDTYFFIYAAMSNTRFHVWYSVDGLGVDPAPANSIGIEVPLSSGDSAAIVANATQLILNMSVYKEYFNATRQNSVLTITNLKKGPVTDSLDGDTTFIISNEAGTKQLVDKVNIDYNNGNPIYNGQELIDYRYNIQTGRFEFRSSGITHIEDDDGHKLDINPDGSINTVPAKLWDNFDVTSRNANGDILQVVYNLGATLVKTVDITYDGAGCLLSYTETEA